MMPHQPISIAVCAAVWLACCGLAAADTLSLHPSQDNSIFDESENSNAKGPLYAGETINGAVRRALLEFDLAHSGIPADAVINSVSLTLTMTKVGPGASALFELHPLLAAWGEGTSTGVGAGNTPTTNDATWHFSLYNSASWSLAGGDFGSTSGTGTIGATLGKYTFASQPGMVSDVQSWLTSPSSNFGWLLKAADESVTNAHELGSRESTLSQQPLLAITYTPTPEPSSLALLAAGGALLALRRLRLPRAA